VELSWTMDLKTIASWATTSNLKLKIDQTRKKGKKNYTLRNKMRPSIIQIFLLLLSPFRKVKIQCWWEITKKKPLFFDFLESDSPLKKFGI